MYQALIVVHVLISIAIIGLVLIQKGRGAEAGAGGFGGGSAASVFGARGSASFLSRATSMLAVVFFSTSLLLAYLGSRQDNKHDIMDTPAEVQNGDLPPVQKDLPAPAAPEQPAPAK
ncbi:MAG: preprotein translocase subunit SecG [Methylococcaceae bacterium]|nr:MAG: preprotein translocase subunit SecG [Methylococcaceae bacterium]